MILFIILVIHIIPAICKFDKSGAYFTANVAIVRLVNVVMPWQAFVKLVAIASILICHVLYLIMTISGIGSNNYI